MMSHVLALVTVAVLGPDPAGVAPGLSPLLAFVQDQGNQGGNQGGNQDNKGAVTPDKNQKGGDSSKGARVQEGKNAPPQKKMTDKKGEGQGAQDGQDKGKGVPQGRPAKGQGQGQGNPQKGKGIKQQNNQGNNPEDQGNRNEPNGSNNNKDDGNSNQNDDGDQ